MLPGAVEQRRVIGLELSLAPRVEMIDVDFFADAALGDEGAEPGGQGDIEAEDEDGLLRGLGEMEAAVAEDERLAGTGDAVDDAVPLAEAAGELLLLEIHYAQEMGNGGFGARLHDFCGDLGTEEVLLDGIDADLGEEMPPDALDLGQRHR